MKDNFLVSASNAREYLVKRIHYVMPNEIASYALATDIADEILREGYQLPRIAKHYRELDALNYGALVQTEGKGNQSDYWEKCGTQWCCLTEAKPRLLEVEKIPLPARVLWEGKVK